MLNLKKTAVAVLALGSSAVFAGTMGPVCTPGNVTVPCERSAWDFGGYALYLQPTYTGDVSYLGHTDTVVGTTDVRTFDNADLDWNWGFKLEGSYHFSTGNDLNLNWYHWKNGTDFAFAGTSLTGLAAAATGGAEITPQWDAVNLEFGQLANFGEFDSIRFHYGLQWAQVQTTTAAFTTVPVVVAAAVQDKFNGVGPRLGMDMQYNFNNGFAVYGNGATALLIGNNKFNSAVVAPAFPGVAGITSLATVGKNNVVVPELEGKLGVKYSYAMPQGELVLDAGWMWVNYFNAQHTISVFGTVNEGSFAVNGPAFGAKWIGSVNI